MLSNRYLAKENCSHWKFEVWPDENKRNSLKKAHSCREEERNAFLSHLVSFMCVFAHVLYRDTAFAYVTTLGNHKSTATRFQMTCEHASGENEKEFGKGSETTSARIGKSKRVGRLGSRVGAGWVGGILPPISSGTWSHGVVFLYPRKLSRHCETSRMDIQLTFFSYMQLNHRISWLAGFSRACSLLDWC